MLSTQRRVIPDFTRCATRTGGMDYGVECSRLRNLFAGKDLDPARYGAIIETLDGRLRGLLLPRIEEFDTVEEQWRALH